MARYQDHMRHNIRVAVSLPQQVVSAVDELAEQRGESRSHFIATLLARVASAKRDREIRAEIDALFADPTVRAEQRDTAEAFLGASPWQREKP
jgi:metal-responsive CopG/Arc/MetJ family transcriptional regulator